MTEQIRITKEDKIPNNHTIINSHTFEGKDKKTKKRENKLKIKRIHNPQEIVDIEEIREEEIEERTWEIRIEERG